MQKLTVGALSVAANSVSASVFAGQNGEYLPARCLVELAIVGSAAGLYETVQIGARSIVQDQYTNPSNRWPIDPDDFNIRFIGLAGEKLNVQLRNSTGGALTVNVVAKFTPV